MPLIYTRTGIYRIKSVIITDNSRMKILLDKIMQERNLSVRQLSIRTGVSKSSIQKIMNEDSNPTIGTLEKLAAGLKCHITDLFESDFK